VDCPEFGDKLGEQSWQDIYNYQLLINKRRAISAQIGMRPHKPVQPTVIANMQ